MIKIKDNDIMHFGKYKGREFKYVPRYYLKHLAQLHIDKKTTIEDQDFFDLLVDYVDELGLLNVKKSG